MPVPIFIWAGAALAAYLFAEVASDIVKEKKKTGRVFATKEEKENDPALNDSSWGGGRDSGYTGN